MVLIFAYSMFFIYFRRLQFQFPPLRRMKRFREWLEAGGDMPDLLQWDLPFVVSTETADSLGLLRLCLCLLPAASLCTAHNTTVARPAAVA